MSDVFQSLAVINIFAATRINNVHKEMPFLLLLVAEDVYKRDQTLSQIQAYIYTDHIS